MELRGRLGALAERNFRLVFSSTTISALGDGVTTIALVFAVLGLMPLGSAVAGPVASAIGVAPTLFATAAIELVCFAIIIAQPSVWAIGAEPAAVPATA
jgi:hypothetical protein